MAKGGRKLTEGAKSKTLHQTFESAGDKRLAKYDDKSQLSFSFQYFKQIPYFQLGEQDNKWFVSLLGRLKDLSGKDSSLLADATAKKSYRLHPIIWNQPNIPIKKSDLDWIPNEYLDSEEIEFQQFEITQSTGRVVGFFNETNEIFHVVLLDPKHNICPTGATGYRLDKTRDCFTDYEELLQQLKDGKPVGEKHVNLSERMIWIDEELVEVFQKYGIKEWEDKLKDILLTELCEEE